MKVFHGLESLDPPLRQVVLTIGNFDGFHRAHRRIVEQARSLARTSSHPRSGSKAAVPPVVVLTFEPHPLSVVAPQRTPARLTTLDQKLHLLSEAGVDVVVVARSEPKLLGLEAERFVEDILMRLFGPTHIVEGPSFGFGRARQGTPELLTRVAARFGCDVQIVDPVTITLEDSESVMVSSSLTRTLVSSGRVHDASLCLGRPYRLTGTVIEGDRRGRTIGFPTANLGDVGQLLPGDGVYAGHVTVAGIAHAAAISIGSTPTFGESAPKFEAHLLDFNDDLYGQSVHIDFERRLRDQCKFASAADLTDQLHRDVEAVRTGHGPSSPCASANETQAS